jgi:hypothetical protein
MAGRSPLLSLLSRCGSTFVGEASYEAMLPVGTDPRAELDRWRSAQVRSAGVVRLVGLTPRQKGRRQPGSRTLRRKQGGIDVPIPTLDVQARWAYSELSGSPFAQYYGGPGIEPLRAKRMSNTQFEQLMPEERYNLAYQCALVRKNLFVFFIGIETFELTQIPRFELGRLHVPANVWNDSGGRFLSFADYMNTQAEDPRDARRVTGSLEDYRLPDDPITIGFAYGHHILIDGYHRAASYWKFGTTDMKIPAYKPNPPSRF